jgi:2-polyprenyl-6-hydroxyphenyl methylase/3-demethylubiquinone-9 3-methyltransferase
MQGRLQRERALRVHYCHQGSNQHYPELKLHKGSAYDDLPAQYGQFPVVISLDVVEHVYSPRKFASTLFGLVAEGGTAIVSTPYHGYWKNLALVLTGKMDDHFTALWDHGHIKFWSMKTMRVILEQAGFRNIIFHRVGRIPVIAKAMFAIAKKESIWAPRY